MNNTFSVIKLRGCRLDQQGVTHGRNRETSLLGTFGTALRLTKHPNLIKGNYYRLESYRSLNLTAEIN
jgi:hypothetical protein